MLKQLGLGLILAGSLLSANSYAKTIETYTLNEKNQPTTVSVEENAQRVVVIDYGALDIVDSLGLGSHVVGIPKGAKAPHVQKYFDDKEHVANVGTLKQVDYEKVMELQPDLIVIGTRLAAEYPKLSKIAPTVYIKMIYDKDYLEVLETNVNAIAKIYGKEDKAAELLKPIKARFEALKQKGEGKSAIIALTTSNAIHLLGNTARSSVISTSFGFKNLGDANTSNHGNEVSFEFIKDKDPDHLFVIDRDVAIGETSFKSAKALLDNDLIKQTSAFKNDNIHYLTPHIWYLSDGGIISTNIMLDEVEKVFE